jgi:CYTH domain-containing protein
MNLATNYAEIERKFLLRGTMPLGVVTHTTEVHRHYLYFDPQTELRIQKKGEDHYELERKILDVNAPLLRWSMKAPLTVGEFERLRACAIGNPIHYKKHRTNISGTSIKEYFNQLAGLFIVEAEFPDLASAQNFHPAQPWMNVEITDLKYSRDSGLIHLTSAELPDIN